MLGQRPYVTIMSLFKQIQGLQDQTLCIHTQEVSVLSIKTLVFWAPVFSKEILLPHEVL